MGPRVEFSIPGAPNGYGYPAEILADVCAAYIEGMMNGTLHPKQVPLAQRAWHIQKAFAKLGIIALVDEVTGFQEQREKNALRLKLSAYLLDVPAEWERMFPPEFYDLLARLYRVRLSGGQRPHIFAWFTRKFVYEPVLDPDVANALDARNPEPHHGSNHHQHFTENTRELVARHLSAVMILLRQSQSFPDFQHRFAVQFSGAPLQFSLPAVA